MRAAWPALLAPLALGGCEDTRLGVFRVDGITLADGAEVEALNGPFYKAIPGQQLRVELSTETELREAGNGQTVYMWGDFCPNRRTKALSTTGPLPDGKQEYPGGGGVSPQRATRDAAGRYHYVVYIEPKGYVRGRGLDYDLRADTRDLCLWAKGTNMFPPHSATVVIPRARIAPLIAQLPR